MFFKLTGEQSLNQERYRAFAQKVVKPLGEMMDENEKMDEGLLVALKKEGFLGIPFAEKYGGVGGTYLDYCLAVEELSKCDGSTGVTISVHTSLCCSCIDSFGTEDQKEKFLRPLVNGTSYGCFGLTEPNAGSDAAGQQTEAVYDESTDEYVINGSKIFTTNAEFADYCVVFAMTNKELGTKGISAFIVDLHTNGVKISPNIRRMGIRAASNCEVFYENVRVPAANRLSDEGNGFKIAMKALDGGRIGIAAQAVGLAQGALDIALAYVKERKQFGRPIAAFQTTQFKLAQMQTEIDAARLLVYRAATSKDDGEVYGPQAAMAKLKASAVANDVAREAVQLMGGYGYCREYQGERFLRDAKITEIYEGTSEVMKMVISGAMKVK
ncbi:MAG: acyl-CoA dehydrogenase family protein [Firmicutes bacterium]|nr:acyl-CoA dehydrogenase family protein [Bacillota bacterium]